MVEENVLPQIVPIAAEIAAVAAGRAVVVAEVGAAAVDRVVADVVAMVVVMADRGTRNLPRVSPIVEKTRKGRCELRPFCFGSPKPRKRETVTGVVETKGLATGSVGNKEFYKR